MSSFHKVTFPSSISFKAEGGPAFKTAIATQKSGKEKRSILWANARSKYEINYKDISKSETNEIISFFMARNGSAYGFRFKDWNDFEVTSQNIGVGDSTTTNFQLIKEYGDDENIYKRVINKPVEGSVSIYVNGTLQQGNYSINYNDGVISFDGAVASGAIITADFEFDIPVRFATDMLIAKTESYLKSSIKSISLIELKL